MNKDQVIRVEGRCGTFRLLYSHDDGFTRYCVEILNDGYVCRLNESAVFDRGTHHKMAKLHGIDLNSMDCQTFREANFGLA